MRSVCVFCGSRPGVLPAYRAAAEDFGERCAARGLALVYGGGHVGLMGTVADAALAAGGEVIGVIPGALRDRELAHAGLTRLEVVDGMAPRKERMAALSDAFAVLPGGWGTLDELFEMLTWNQLGLAAQPVGLLDAGGFYTPLVDFLERVRDAGFVAPAQHAELLVESSADALLDALEAACPRT